MKTNCGICGEDKQCTLCECESCRYDVTSEAELNNEEPPKEPVGRWLCKNCIKMGGE